MSLFDMRWCVLFERIICIFKIYVMSRISVQFWRIGEHTFEYSRCGFEIRHCRIPDGLFAWGFRVFLLCNVYTNLLAKMLNTASILATSIFSAIPEIALDFRPDSNSGTLEMLTLSLIYNSSLKGTHWTLTPTPTSTILPTLFPPHQQINDDFCEFLLIY